MTREESYRCVQRRDSMICIAFFCIIVLGVVLAMPFVAQGQTSHAERTSQFVCVQSGDTLWSIGAEHCGQGLSVAESVHWIADRNDLSSSLIVPGQIIEVPAF